MSRRMDKTKKVGIKMGNVFFFTDIHGNKELYNTIIEYCKDNLIIFGGDAADRGPDGYYIIKDLLTRPNVIYLKGNHEDIFVKAVKEFNQHFPNPQFSEERLNTILKSINVFDEKYRALQLLLYNGGKETFISWFNDGRPMRMINQLEHLPLTMSYNNLDFCHAGAVYSSFARKKRTIQEEELLMWDRSAFDYGWTPNRICVHGHTPVAAMPAKFQKMTKENIIPLKYHGDFNEKMTGSKINMDTGVFWSRRAFVLDCNTLNATGFFEDEKHIIKQIETITL